MLNPYTSQAPHADGRRKSCQTNAMRHGLRSEAIILPWESASDYENLEAELVRNLKPIGDGERNCVVGLAGCLWRLKRIPPAESTLIIKEKQRAEAWTALRELSRTPLREVPGTLSDSSSVAREPETAMPTSEAYINGKSARRVLDFESGLLRNAKRWASLLRELQGLRGATRTIIDVAQDGVGKIDSNTER